MKLLSLTIFVLCFSQLSSAAELRSELLESKNHISVLGVFNSFKTEEGSISGSGLGVEFAHSFSPKWGLDVSISTGLSQEDSVSNSFTGLSAYMLYNLFSNCCDRSRIITVGGTPLLTETTEEPYLFQVGFGINQFFLNGNRGVYSSSGPGIGSNFIFLFSNFKIKLTARFSKMMSNDTDVDGTFLGAGLIFPL